MAQLVEQLNGLGYTGPASEPMVLEGAIIEGPKSIIYTELVAWLSKELQVLCELESCVNPTIDAEDSSSFLLEISSFLKDLDCPYQCLMEGSVSQRLISNQNRMLLIDYLCSELQAARMIAVNKPDKSKSMEVEMQESPTAKAIKEMLISLGFSKPPPNITPIQLFTKVEGKLKDLLGKFPTAQVGEPLFTGTLSEKQWFALEKLQKQMFEDYTTRRNMLIIRLDVTIQSFSWSDRLKNSSEKITQMYAVKRKQLSSKPCVQISDLLAARSDLVIIEKTSSAAVRKNTKSSVNNVVIGNVPDRGGRPEEQQPPPPEVPSWQKREPPKSNFSDQRGPPKNNFGDPRGPPKSNFGDQRGPPKSNFDQRGDTSGSWRNDRAQSAPMSQTFQPIPAVNYMPGSAMPPAHYYQQVTGGFPHNDFGVGFGGYAATGGNFQQFGVTYMQGGGDYSDRGGRGGRGPRGGRGRGGRRGGGGDAFHGGGGYAPRRQ